MRRALLLLMPLLALVLAVAAVRAGPVLAAAPAKIRQTGGGQTDQASRRVALVMGNSAYRTVAPLPNPANDARLMAEALKSLGFELVGGRALTDLAGKADMEQAVQRFGEMVKGAAVGVFFYAGHGVQVDGKNYLVPVGANVAARTQIKYQLLDADYVLDEMAAAGTQVNVVVLDACRNNPFGDRGLRDVAAGLAQIMAPKGTLLAYSTAPGRTAADGAGNNSPFTQALARHIRTPGLRIDDVFMRVGVEVEQKTGGEQSPWKSDNLRGVFCLSGQCGTPQDGISAAAAGNGARIAALEKELAEKTALAEQAKAQAARIAPQAALIRPDSRQDQYARPDPLAALEWDAFWRLGVLHWQDARFEVSLDEKNKAVGSAKSLRVDYSLPPGSSEVLACVQSRKKRDLSGFAGIEFSVMASQPLAGHLNISTSSPSNPKMVDRFSATFKIGSSWQVVRIPFERLAVSSSWVRVGAARQGLTPGDGVPHLERTEELRIGVDPLYNPPGQGRFWVDSIRFYK